MKATRMALIGLIVVLSVVIFLYVDNKEYNRLVNDQKYPLVEQLENRPVSISPDSQKIEGTGLELSELYYSYPEEGLYFGFWYRNGNNLLNNEDKNWKREDGAVQFLVKVVDEEGTTYNGTTTGKAEGTFSTFQYLQVDDFTLPEEDEEEEVSEEQEQRELDLSFYPIMEDGEPNEEALFELSVPLIK